MINELWGSFPRLLEQNINGLLDTAEPRPTKAFQLYKRCQQEDLWSGSYEEFSKILNDFFSKPRMQRRKSDVDKFLDRPMDHDVFSAFHLNFRTALVSEKEVDDLASWTHHLIRVAKKIDSEVISLDTILKTLKSITNPKPLEKAEDITFEDFCATWKKTVFASFGETFETELTTLVTELRAINSDLKQLEKASPGNLLPTLYLTPPEFEWVEAVQLAAIENKGIPKFPFAKGPSKQRLLDLERVITLYELVQMTTLPELLKHRESIRLTLLDRCQGLLKEKAAS